MTYNLAKIYRLFAFVAVMAASVAMWSCQDDPLLADGPIGEGTARVQATVSFTPMGSALDSRSSGEAIKSLDPDKIYLFIYDVNHKLVEMRHVTGARVTNDNNDRPAGDTSVSAETNSARATFNFNLDFGRYHIYVVGNVNVENEWNQTTDYSTVEQLLNRSAKWDSSDPAKNNQLFGYFSAKGEASSLSSPEPITINQGAVNLIAWVKRLASKVTLAFDTRHLRENVYIYIKSVTIKDIPEECYFGRENTPGEENQEDPRYISNTLLRGETIYYAGANASQTDANANYRNWYCLTTGDSISGWYADRNTALVQNKNLTAEERLALEHSQTAEALYFFENIQGYGKEGTTSDKRQDVSGENSSVSYPDGVKPDNEAWKDAKRYGSYIEVEAYYISNEAKRPGRGAIRYRFMLGKDTKLDYNAERNHHYKLTLNFNGYANDIDWHIEYDEEDRPGLYSPDEYYVSYLYNQEATIPVRATPKQGFHLQSLKAVIVDNEWRPYDAKVAYNEKAWKMQTEETDEYVAYKNPDDPDCAKNVELGYLSLRKPINVVFNAEGSVSTYTKMITELQNYYHEHNQGMRTFTLFPSKDNMHKPDGDSFGEESTGGSYTAFLDESNDRKDYIINIPVYTREKTLDQWGVYTGANAYYGHYCYARVKFIATYVSDTDPDETYTDKAYTHVYQARRIDNPRGIYRRWNATSLNSFHVVLHYQTPGAFTYTAMESMGPWSVEIARDPKGIVQLTKDGKTVSGEGAKLYGHNGTLVDFYYKPTGSLSSKDETAGAILEIRYHNYTCVHKILIRQGYAPMQVADGGSYWSSFNMYKDGELVNSPLSIGSFFRLWQNFDYPIAESNNTRPGFGVGKAPSALYDIVGRSDQIAWDNIPHYRTAARTHADSTVFKNFKIPGRYEYRIPTYTDLFDFVDDDPNDFSNINFAYGVVYADGASTTLDTDLAASYSNPTNSTELRDQVFGVLGVVVYNLDNGHQVFFPYGATGHGRRKNKQWYLTDLSGDNAGKHGMNVQHANGLLRYGTVDIRIGGYDGASAGSGKRVANDFRPNAYDLPSQFGAAYWINCRNPENYANQKDVPIAIDINASTYQFFRLLVDDVLFGNNSTDKQSGYDALPVRAVLDLPRGQHPEWDPEDNN